MRQIIKYLNVCLKMTIVYMCVYVFRLSCLHWVNKPPLVTGSPLGKELYALTTAEMTVARFNSALWILSHAAKHPKVNRNHGRHWALLWNEITDEKKGKKCIFKVCPRVNVNREPFPSSAVNSHWWLFSSLYRSGHENVDLYLLINASWNSICINQGDKKNWMPALAWQP